MAEALAQLHALLRPSFTDTKADLWKIQSKPRMEERLVL